MTNKIRHLKYEEVYVIIYDKMEELNNLMGDIVENYEKDFLSSYKEHMQRVQKEIMAMKNQLSE